MAIAYKTIDITIVSMKKTDYITKEYFDNYTAQWQKDVKQHMTDLTTDFTELVKGIEDQLASIGQKVTSLDQKMDNLIKRLHY